MQGMINDFLRSSDRWPWSSSLSSCGFVTPIAETNLPPPALAHPRLPHNKRLTWSGGCSKHAASSANSNVSRFQYNLQQKDRHNSNLFQTTDAALARDIHPTCSILFTITIPVILIGNSTYRSPSFEEVRLESASVDGSRQWRCRSVPGLSHVDAVGLRLSMAVDGRRHILLRKPHAELKKKLVSMATSLRLSTSILPLLFVCDVGLLLDMAEHSQTAPSIPSLRR
jgi:hypothetical protein